MIKSRAEIALLQRANDLTITAYKAAFPRLREGMTNADVSKMIEQEYEKLGVKGDAMVIFGTYTAGSLAQRFPKHRILSGIYLARAVGISAFLLALPFFSATNFPVRARVALGVSRT